MIFFRKYMEKTVINDILNRRSIRKYKPQQITDVILEQILLCAINAPSALNLQPWQIRVVQDKNILGEMNKAFVDWAKDKQLPGSASRAKEEGFSVFHHAPTLIIVAADTENSYSEGDCGMLTQNILLAAHSLDIGTCVIGSMAKMLNQSSYLKQEVLQISDNYKILFGIAMGYADETPDAKPRDKDKIKRI